MSQELEDIYYDVFYDDYFTKSEIIDNLIDLEVQKNITKCESIYMNNIMGKVLEDFDELEKTDTITTFFSGNENTKAWQDFLNCHPEYIKS